MSLMTRNTALLAAILLAAPTMAGEIQQVSCSAEGCNAKTKHTRCQNCRNMNSQCQSCNACDSCDNCDSCDSNAGKCSMRDRRDAFALDWASKCGPIGRRAAKGGHLAQKLHWHCTTKAYPDSGWAPPATRPVTRTSRSYTAYNNFGMGGHAPAAPMIYQPTDTTQMGYSYANVPQWRPNPGMIPSVPQPSNFHTRFCPSQCGGNSGCLNGQCGGRVIGQDVYYESTGSSCPSCNLGAVQQPVQHQQVAARPTAQPRQVSLPSVAALDAAPLKPVVSKVRAITPPLVQVTQATNNAKPQVKQVSQQRTVRPANQTAQQRVRPANNSRRPQQQKSGGWLGLPSLRDMKF